MLLYTIDNKEKSNKPIGNLTISSLSKSRHVLARPSNLRQTQIAGGKEAVPSKEADVNPDTIIQVEGPTKSQYQTAVERQTRENILDIFRQIQNNRYITSRYPRQIINEYLGEYKRQYFQTPVDKDRYYNYYNLTLFYDKDILTTLKRAKVVTVLRTSTK